MALSDFIWYEKHRPKKLAELSLAPQYRKNFVEYIDKGEIPHLLFYGSVGSGKTTVAFILMDSIECSRLVLNASSSDRGVATIKVKVKQFAASKAMDGKLKVVFFDEADGLTQDAQDALRNTIETYSKSCRFILTCNNIEKISAALKSRCVQYQFNSFPEDQLLKKVQHILKLEEIEYDPEDVKEIIELHYPDVRSVINTVQNCSVDGVLELSRIRDFNVDKAGLLDLLYDGEIGKIRVLVNGVLDFLGIYKYFYDELLSSRELKADEKKDIVLILAESLFRDALSVSKEINFIGCCLQIAEVLGCRKISFQF